MQIGFYLVAVIKPQSTIVYPIRRSLILPTGNCHTRDIFRHAAAHMHCDGGHHLAMAWDILASEFGRCRDTSADRARPARIVLLALVVALLPLRAIAFPLGGDQTVLPAGTELSEDALARPRELFHSEAMGGRKSYLVNLGDLAFNSPAILGGKARQAEMSCGTCHVNGASNPKLFVPGGILPPGHVRHLKPDLQREDIQQHPRSGQDSEPAGRPPPRPLRARRAHHLAARVRI
ncbi:hypothetical protein [Bradyrhizobium sp. USDA 4451]